MADAGAFINWGPPTTPIVFTPPICGPPAAPPPPARTGRPADSQISQRLQESHFYGTLAFQNGRSPERLFNYAPPKKRPLEASVSNENVAPAVFTFGSPSPVETTERPAKRSKPNPSLAPMSAVPPKRKSSRTDSQKISLVLDTIHAQNWTLADFLYNIFRTKDAKGKEIHRDQTHSQMVSIFLAGRARKTPANIICEWMAHPDGRIPQNSPNSDLMYSTTIPYTNIGPVRAALTSFATQIVGTKVALEAENAVQLKNGLHVSLGKRHPEMRLSRNDIGEATIPRVQAAIELYQAVTLYLFRKIAVRKPRKRYGEVLERKTRPPDIVITHSISTLNFCRTDQANLLPLMRGILYFGSSAPVELMNYNCRIGNMSAPATTRRALIVLSDAEASATATHGRDPETAGFLFVDNCQNEAKVRDLRIGRQTVMNVGMSGLYMEAPEIDPEVFSLEEKRALIALNLRQDITVDDLLAFLDQDDADFMGTMLVLDTLARGIPGLKPVQKEVALRISATTKISVPPGQAIVHPLACSGKKETIPTELKDGMLDFLQQVGQTPESFLKRKLPVGGDGLTYAMLQQLQTYLQYNDDAFKSFEIIEPQLQVWHTKWTDIIRIYQTHWGRTSGKNTNPASLGFSAAKIGRAAPSNMKKVEFYPGAQLLYLVLDAKLLDIWRIAFKTNDIFEYFEGLVENKTLPDFETLLGMARKLYRAYGTARGRDHAIHDTGSTSEWAQTVPTGSAWIPRDIEESSLENKKSSKKKTANPTTRKARNPKAKPLAKPCKGDFVLAQNIDFIRDGLNSRKLTTAIARGDLGRLYECIKYMLFTFGGSTHTNYLNYVLETIMNLELECSPGLKLALLRGLVWSLTGLTDHCEEGDFIVEFFNRLLEDVVEHKSAQFDDIFIRDIISRNLRHLAQLKVAWRTGVGMDKKSHKHADPHTRPEIHTLLKVYRDTELSSRRLTRQIDDRDTDDFARGVKKLRDGALQKANTRTALNRQVFRTDAPVDVVDANQPVSDDDSDDSDDSGSESSSTAESESDSDDDAGPSKFYATRGSTFMVDGELFFDERDMLQGPEDEEYMEDGDAEGDLDDT